MAPSRSAGWSPSRPSSASGWSSVAALDPVACGDETTPCVVVTTADQQAVDVEWFAAILGALGLLVLLSAARTIHAFGLGGN